MKTALAWRGPFTNTEVNALHAEAFQTRLFSDNEWDWVSQVQAHSLGWVTARNGSELVGFVNALWDGLTHVWIQDLMVSEAARHQGIGVGLVHLARDHASSSGCEWLHVDFDEGLEPFYLQACGFVPTLAGLMELKPHRAEL